MPSYTHMRRAQPVLAAHYFLAHATAIRRDHDRFDGVLAEVDELPLGSGAIAGTSYPIDTAWLASTLGFSRIVANSIDATGDRDFVSTFLHASALTMVHLSRLAEDLILFTSEEFRFFELSDTAATGSSLMPQKKNPDPLELVRGKSGRVLGRLTGWLASMKGLPVGYSKDLQEDKEALFEAEDTVNASVAACASVLRESRSIATSPPPRRPVSCSPPTWPTISSCAVFHSAMPTRSSARWYGASWTNGEDSTSYRSTSGARTRGCSMRTSRSTSPRMRPSAASARRSPHTRMRSRRP